jgi:hypothetical protein
MERCPNCRARRDDGATCRRCGMDLSALLAVERAVETLAAQAVAQLAAGSVPAAVDTLLQARRLSAEPFVGQLLGFALSLDRDAPPRDQADVPPAAPDIPDIPDIPEPAAARNGIYNPFPNIWGRPGDWDVAAADPMP